MEVKRENVLAIAGEKDTLICRKCATDQDWAAVEVREALVTAAKLEKSQSLYFCDRCSKRIKA